LPILFSKEREADPSAIAVRTLPKDSRQVASVSDQHVGRPIPRQSSAVDPLHGGVKAYRQLLHDHASGNGRGRCRRRGHRYGRLMRKRVMGKEQGKDDRDRRAAPTGEEGPTPPRCVGRFCVDDHRSFLPYQPTFQMDDRHCPRRCRRPKRRRATTPQPGCRGRSRQARGTRSTAA
jgi:hypothetical protein